MDEKTIRRILRRLNRLEDTIDGIKKTLGLCVVAVCASILLRYAETGANLSPDTRALIENVIVALVLGSGAGGALSFTSKKPINDDDDE